MNRLSRFLVGFGFFWFTVWSVIGSLIGARLNTTAASIDTAWLASWERMLLRTAHAHMNTMAIVLVLMGLSLRHMLRTVTAPWLTRISLVAVASVVVFGCGLVLEAFNPPGPGHIPLTTAITALGGIGFICCMGFWGSVFLYESTRN